MILGGDLMLLQSTELWPWDLLWDPLKSMPSPRRSGTAQCPQPPAHGSVASMQMCVPIVTKQWVCLLAQWPYTVILVPL